MTLPLVIRLTAHSQGDNMNLNKRNIKVNQDDDEDMNLGGMNSIQMYRQVITADSVDVYLDEAIGSLPYYRNLIQYLHNMSEQDTIRIWIDGPGGMLDTALAIIEAMQNSAGNVICIVQGQASSAHSLIALAAPSLMLMNNARFFLHAPSYGSTGKTFEIENRVDFHKEFTRKVAMNSYGGFLSQEEFDLMFVGKDYYFDGAELQRRVNARYAYLDSLVESESETNDEQEEQPESEFETNAKIEVVEDVKPKRVRKPKVSA